MDLINEALKETKDIPLTFLQLAELSGYTEEELKYAKLFWETTFNQSWLYLSDDYIKEWLTNEQKKNTLEHFYNRNLIKNYEENIDYKKIKKDHPLVEKYRWSKNTTDKKIPSNRKKYFIVTGDCLKNLLMTSKTQRGQIIRNYFIKTEKLAMMMFKYLHLLDKKYINELKEEVKTLEFSNKLLSTVYNPPKQYIYVASTNNYMKDNIYKIGRTINLQSRLSTYNTGRPDYDRYEYVKIYECDNYVDKEREINTSLLSYKLNPRKELFVMDYNNICEKIEDIL